MHLVLYNGTFGERYDRSVDGFTDGGKVGIEECRDDAPDFGGVGGYGSMKAIATCTAGDLFELGEGKEVVSTAVEF
jgi:hypothetical protein